jgi:hypothetical protein
MKIVIISVSLRLCGLSELQLLRGQVRSYVVQLHKYVQLHNIITLLLQYTTNKTLLKPALYVLSY